MIRKNVFSTFTHFIAWVLKSDVLLVGDHGDSDASGAKFLAAVKPKIAVISCGKKELFRRKAMIFTPGEMVACTLKPEAFEGLDGSEPIRVAIEEKPQEQR